jgi:hypothetical protein
MKPVSKADTKKPDYPNRRDFLGIVGIAALAVPAVAMAGAPRIADGMRALTKKVDKKKAFCADTCGKQIDAQIKLLGSTDFKVRKQATAKLIAIGKAEGVDKKIAEQKRALIISRLQKLKTAKDPEIVSRATSIIKAVTPKKKVVPVRPHVGIAGGIKAR